MNASDVEQQHGSPNAEPSWAALALVFLGLAMVLCATLVLPWPSDLQGQVRAQLVPHWERLLAADNAEVLAFAQLPDEQPPASWLWRRVWDGLHYVLLLAGLGFAVWAAITPRRLPWVALGIIGLLGTGYAARMVLYNGALVATPGYLLVCFGAVFTVLTWPQGA